MRLTDEIIEIEKRNSAKVDINGHNKQVLTCPEMSFSYQAKHELPALLNNGHCLINRGELASLMASPGVGKTTLTEGLVSSLIASKYNLSSVDTFGFTYNSIGKKVLLCDTERTEDDCSKTYHNIYKRLFKPTQILTDDGLKMKDLTHLVMGEIGEADKLRKTLDQYIKTGDYELVILDGILDFCLSMLDDKDATKVVRWIRSLAVKYNCAIVATIHPNKGTDNPAGHIGAFLYRWSRAFLLVRTTSDRNIKEITADFATAKLSHANIGSFEPVYFTWDEARAMMVTCSAPQQPTYKINYLKQAVMELRLQGSNEIISATLRDHYSKLSGVKPETAKKHIHMACKDGLLIPIGEGKSTRYLPASDWNISPTDSGIVAPYIYKGAYPNPTDISVINPNNTRINDKGYPKDWN